MSETTPQNELDAVIVSYLAGTEPETIARIAREIKRPYTSVLVHCLALAAAGILKITWHDHTRVVGLTSKIEHGHHV